MCGILVIGFVDMWYGFWNRWLRNLVCYVCVFDFDEVVVFGGNVEEGDM